MLLRGDALRMAPRMISPTGGPYAGTPYESPQTSGERRKFAEFDYDSQAHKHGGMSLSCTFVCVTRIVSAYRFLQDFRNTLFVY